MSLTPEIIERVKLLNDKYEAMGQDLAAYLDGLLYADYLTYWDYIHLDTLLTLQNPKTNIPDEKIFIIYHQITELYFNLCLQEFYQIGDREPITADFLYQRLMRINRYIEALVNSFNVMVDGMDKEQFLKFRMSLLPASGFQSGQFRMIEICSTDFMNLVSPSERSQLANAPIEALYQFIYWKEGATELSSGKKTLTLKQFEEKYARQFIELGNKFVTRNLWYKYKSLSEPEQKNEQLINGFRLLDTSINVNWRLAHYKSAVRYLHRDPVDIAATGGTNWQKYLPPRFQRVIFYPELWTLQEKNEWGKSWVINQIFPQ